MAVYKILFKKSATKDLDSIPGVDLKRILDRIYSLALNPRPVGSEKLADRSLYRVRQGKYRIVYTIQDSELTVWVVAVGHRREIYRR